MLCHRHGCWSWGRLHFRMGNKTGNNVLSYALQVKYSYVFDIGTLGEPGTWVLQNRRVFAHCDKGFPDGIKCDTQGNVYSGCGDGVHVPF